jgi:integrase/recombinase XerD
MNEIKRTSAKKKAKELAKYLRAERPDYAYLKSVFQYLRNELEVEVSKANKRLPYVPTEEEIKRYYQAVWCYRSL